MYNKLFKFFVHITWKGWHKKMVAKIFTDICDELHVEKFHKIDSFIEFLKSSSGKLRKKDTLAVLHQAQRICGSLSKEVQYYIADKLDVNISDIEATINFYEYFIKDTRSEHILTPN